MKLCRTYLTAHPKQPFSHLKNAAKNNCLLILLLFFPISSPANKTFVPTANLNQYGAQLSSRYLKRVSDDAENGNNSNEFVNIAEIGWRNIMTGYVWKPWFGTWSGNTNLRLQTRWQTGTNFQKSSLMGLLGESRWDLNLFSASKFPFKGVFDVSHINEEKDFQDELVSRYRVVMDQRYTFPNKVSSVRGKFLMQGRNSDTSGQSKELQLSFGAKHTTGPHAVNGEIEFLLTNNDSADEELDDLKENIRFNLFTRHRYNPFKALSMENFVSFSNRDERYELSDRSRTDWQLNTNTVWSPEDEPRLIVTGGGRLSGNENSQQNQTQITSSSEQQNLSLYAGAGFDYTPEIRMDASLSLNTVRNNGTTSTNSSQQIGASYSPELIKLWNFDYAWYASANASNNITTDESYQQFTSNLGQTFKRAVYMLADSPVRLNINNQIDSTLSNKSDSKNRSSLFNRISLNHTFNEDGLYSYIQLAYDDEWGTGGSDGDIKRKHTLSTLFSGNFQVNRYASWSGDINLELEQETHNNGESKTRLFSSGFLAYRHNRFFNILRLRFLSRLTLSMEDLLSQDSIEEEELFGDDELSSNIWENRLSYQLGRFSFNSRLSISQNKESTNGIIMFELKRRFGYY